MKVLLLFVLMVAGFYYGPIFYNERGVPTRETATERNVVLENEEPLTMEKANEGRTKYQR